MRRLPPISTRTYTLLPYTTLFRSTRGTGLGSLVFNPDHKRNGSFSHQIFDPAGAFKNRKVKDLSQCAAHLEYRVGGDPVSRSEEHTSELQSLMRISYAVF